VSFISATPWEAPIPHNLKLLSEEMLFKFIHLRLTPTPCGCKAHARKPGGGICPLRPSWASVLRLDMSLDVSKCISCTNIAPKLPCSLSKFMKMSFLTSSSIRLRHSVTIAERIWFCDGRISMQTSSVKLSRSSVTQPESWTCSLFRANLVRSIISYLSAIANTWVFSSALA